MRYVNKRKTTKIPPRRGLGILITVLLSTAIWFTMRDLTGTYDPQSHPGYVNYAYPSMIVSSLVLGYFFPHHGWLLGFYMIAVQLVLGLLLLAGDYNVLPMGVILHFILALPCMVSAWFGSWLGGNSIW
jgi:hypothetical protein